MFGKEGGGMTGMCIFNRKERRKPADDGENLMDSQGHGQAISSPSAQCGPGVDCHFCL